MPNRARRVDVCLTLQKRQELLQFWIDKHESDVEQKQRELDLLKSAKAKDLERLQELTRLVSICIFWA